MSGNLTRVEITKEGHLTDAAGVVLTTRELQDMGIKEPFLMPTEKEVIGVSYSFAPKEEERFKKLLKEAFWVGSYLRVKSIFRLVGGCYYVRKWVKAGLLHDLGLEKGTKGNPHVFELNTVEIPHELLSEL